MTNCSFAFAQLFRFIPFKSLRIWNKGLAMCDRLFPKPNLSTPFYAGNGYRLSAGTTNLYYIAGTHELGLLEEIDRRLKTDDCVVDIGANAGTSILWLHHRSPQKQLSFVAFEAMPANVEILNENLSLNPNVNCNVIPCALGAADNVELHFGIAGAGDGSARDESLIASTDWTNRERVCVPSFTLDTKMMSTSRAPSLLLIDVEGYAGEVLKGAMNVLSQFKPVVVIEIHGLAEQESVSNMLLPLGYNVTYTSRKYGFHQIYEFH
ncbi:MAG: FkbM family methyltransferase [Pirellula sp.]